MDTERLMESLLAKGKDQHMSNEERLRDGRPNIEGEGGKKQELNNRPKKRKRGACLLG